MLATVPRRLWLPVATVAVLLSSCWVDSVLLTDRVRLVAWITVRPGNSSHGYQTCLYADVRNETFPYLDLTKSFVELGNIREIESRAMAATLEACSGSHSNNSHEPRIFPVNLHKIIYPGTKWCGKGDVANDANDLGYFRETDICCQEHDTCNNIRSGDNTTIRPGNETDSEKDCQCDFTFQDCLRSEGSTVSQKVSRLYFKQAGVRCLPEEPGSVHFISIEEQKNIPSGPKGGFWEWLKKIFTFFPKAIPRG